MKKKTAVLQIAATYIGTVIGAGFATGREIVEFFISYGVAGLLGILLCGVFLVWIGTKIMLLAHRYGFPSYEPFNHYLFGKKLGSAVNLLFLVILLGSTSVMVAGTGSIFHEQLGLPGQWGILLVLILCFFAMLKGLSGIFAVNILVVPVMLSFTFLIAVFTLWADPVRGFSNVADSTSHWGWLFSALTYASYNLAMAQAVLVPLGKEIDDEKVLNRGGILGGVGLTFILITAYIVLMQLPDVARFQIPMAQLVKSFGPFIHTMYVAVIFGEIFTTVIGNVFGLTRQLRDRLHLPESVIVLGILFICYWVSLADFSTLLSFLYRIFGTIGFLVLFYLIFPRLRRMTRFK
ncbi:MAG TPA: hypothetical protein VFK33_09540 [Bacillales bacterium]|nr:hypothetical protein [Bacillales bacterium]